MTSNKHYKGKATSTPLNGKAVRYMKWITILFYLLCAWFYLYRGELFDNRNLWSYALACTGPNLLWSFLFTWFSMMYVVPRFFRGRIARNDSNALLVVNLFNLSLFSFIESLHVLLNVGHWDTLDIVASTIGMLCASCLYLLLKNTFSK